MTTPQAPTPPTPAVKHLSLGLLVLSAAMFILAAYLLHADVMIAVASHSPIPTLDLAFVLICALVGYLTAGGANAKDALTSLAGFLPTLRGLKERE